MNSSKNEYIITKEKKRKGKEEKERKREKERTRKSPNPLQCEEVSYVKVSIGKRHAAPSYGNHRLGMHPFFWVIVSRFDL